MPSPISKFSLRNMAFRLVLVLGIVSFFSDMTYEAARSITGPYLAFLGASATVVGVVAGLGEFAGYGLRLLSGLWVDKTKHYWWIIFSGYCINLFAVPLLALTHHWPMAAVLMILERSGKAIRSPGRDAILSHASRDIGLGIGFGIHEAMDELGAFLGPLIVTVVLLLHGGYRESFAVLLIPAVLAIAILVYGQKLARILHEHPIANAAKVATAAFPAQNAQSQTAPSMLPRILGVKPCCDNLCSALITDVHAISGLRSAPEQLMVSRPNLQGHNLPSRYWVYLLTCALIAAGYVDFPLIAYHFEQAKVLPTLWIPVAYSVAMGCSALSSLVFGHLYDRKGMGLLLVSTGVSLFFAPLVFLGNLEWSLVGMALWGIGMGAQGSMIKATIGQMVAPERRASAYGIFYAAFGSAWLVGSAAMGFLYEYSLLTVVLLSMLLQLAALPVVWMLLRKSS